MEQVNMYISIRNYGVTSKINYALKILCILITQIIIQGINFLVLFKCGTFHDIQSLKKDRFSSFYTNTFNQSELF